MDILKQLELLKRGVDKIISEEELKSKLRKSKSTKTPLKIKAGFDPTAADIHLGHTVILRKLRQFQELGHIVYFLIGDFTARIGDPSGRPDRRRQLTKEEVIKNALTYKKQVCKILDVDRIEIVFNSKWFDKMSVFEMLNLTTHATVSQMLARADFKKRLSQNEDISILEFMYPILQGYDSVKLEADIELGGTDQIFNLLVGRDMQKDFGQEPQVIITLPLLEGTDGVQKMSKSYGNYIGVTDTPKEMFGKTMSISDALMLRFYELLTGEELDLVKHMHPRDAKLRLAKILVEQYYSRDEAEKQEQEFNLVFAKNELPKDIIEYKVNKNDKVIQVLLDSGLVKTGNEARRLIRQGAVVFNDEKITKDDLVFDNDGILKVGTRRFLKVVLKEG